jgi:periplasmic protein TonB
MASTVQPSGFQWNRSSAISATLLLHALAALAMLAPPGLIEAPRAAAPPVQPITIKPEEPPPPPPPPRPEPVVFRPKPVVRPQVVKQPEVRPQQPIVTDLPTPVSVPAVPDTAPVESIAAPVADTAPSAVGYKSMKQVPYPRISITRREEGTVMLRVLVGTDGAPQQIEVERSSGHVALDRAAREAVMKWRFEPGTRNGAPYAAWGLVPISFRLSEL